MQPCNECHACSFPDKVTQAKATLPMKWRAELTDGDAPDQVWLAAMNLHDSFVAENKPVPELFSDLLLGGALDEDDFAWAKKQLEDIVG